MKNYPHILAEIARTPWAMTQSAVAAVNRAARGGLDASDYPTLHGSDPDAQVAVSEQLGTKSEGARLSSVRDGIGILQINGPLIPRGDAMTAMSGLTTIDTLSREFSALVSDPSVRRIVLVIDSPGGAITGISEFASMVASAGKPTTAYVYGMAASAAYWIASAADEIIVGDTAMVGSIGVVMSIPPKGENDDVEFVSSQSPLKRLDIETDEGADEVQRMVNALADVFIATVARNRGVTPAVVADKYGRGGLVLPAQALASGMVDARMTLANFLSGSENGELTKSKHFNNFAIDNPSTAAENEESEITISNPEDRMNLTEFLKANPDAAAEIDLIKSASEQAGRACATLETNERNGFASKILASSVYPASLKGIASAVLSGERSAEHLKIAVDVYDAMKAEATISGAVADSAATPATPPQNTEPLSMDGVLRTPADIDAAAAAMKAGR